MQSAMIVGTRINSVGCMEEDLQGKTGHALKNKRVRGKFFAGKSSHDDNFLFRLR